MRIKKISAISIPPVKKFEVDDLSDLVVIAGANGVGKTRLVNSLLQYFQHLNTPNISFVIEATNKDEEDIFAQKTIETSNPQDAQKLRLLLQHNKKRRNLKSSVVYFESSRSIQKIQPLSFQFDYPDPWEEELGWQMSFSGLVNRWQDTQHAIFKKIQSQKSSIANRAIKLKQDGFEAMNLDFSDPLDPFRKVFSQLLGPKKLAAADVQKQTLMYEYNGETREINTLSSGEREVLNITFDFLLRSPSDCIVFFDEPELHLHPELIIKLISTLKSIGKNNQFILISHSPDVISSSLEDTVIFLTPPKENDENQGIVVKAHDDTSEALSQLGQSVGIVALGKKIVLIEGNGSSLDKQTYTDILRNEFSNLVLLPSEGKNNLTTFNTVMNKVLNQSVWGINFYMLADRDAVPNTNLLKDTPPNFKTLSKYHLENYFLNSNLISKCFEKMEPEGSWLRNPDEIEKKLIEIAKEQISYATALITSKYIRDHIGNIDIMIKNAQGLDKDTLTSNILRKCDSEKTRIQSSIDENDIKLYSENIYKRLYDQLENGNQDWKNDIPAKTILAIFCTQAKISQGRFKSLYISHALESEPEENPFSEIRNLFKEFSEMK